jgi:predicted DNA-binding ribbon-helix-helix protein
MTLSELVATIDTGRDHGNLSSAIRLFVLGHYRENAQGHAHERGPIVREMAPSLSPSETE